MSLKDLPELPGVDHRQVRVGDVRLHVAQAGAGRPLLLLHGWPQHWWCWRHMLPQLANEYRVMAVDLRGWGWSDAPPGDYAKATFAADILALLEREGLERVSLVGHDWGGYTAFLLAREHPEKIERLVALDIVPPWVRRPARPHIALPSLLSYQGLVATPMLGPRTMTASNLFIRSIIRLGSSRSHRFSEAELDVYANRLRDPARARASSACYRTFLTRELPGLLRQGYRPSDLNVPTLLVMGSQSVLQHALDHRPSSHLRLEWIRGAGHFLPEEAPERVLELTQEFLRA